MPKKSEESILSELLLVGLGLFSSGRGEFRKAMDKAVREGKLKQKEGKKLFKKLSHKTEKQRSEVKEVIEEEIGKALKKIGIASPQEVNQLLHQVDRLDTRTEKVQKKKKKRKKRVKKEVPSVAPAPSAETPSPALESTATAEQKAPETTQ